MKKEENRRKRKKTSLEDTISPSDVLSRVHHIPATLLLSTEPLAPTYTYVRLYYAPALIKPYHLQLKSKLQC